MLASSAMPYGTCRGSSSSRMTGLMNRTLAMLSLSSCRVRDVHVQLAREVPLVDADDLVEELGGDGPAHRLGQPALEHPLDERDVRGVEARRPRPLLPQRRCGRHLVLRAMRVDEAAHPPGERGVIR